MINKNIRKFKLKSGLSSMETFEVERLLWNAIRTPDGTVMESLHVHDYRTYRDANGHIYMVDGGNDYLRRNVHFDTPHEELSVYMDEDHEINRLYFKWTSYGVNGDEPAKTQVLRDMSTSHIHNIIKDAQTSGWILELLEAELEFRS